MKTKTTHVMTDAEKIAIKRGVAEIKAGRTTSWQLLRMELGLPDPIMLRESGKCFACGEPSRASDNSIHTRLFEESPRVAYAIELCCACVQCGGDHVR